MAIGSRSQTSRTYLEKYFDEFSNSDLDGLIKHAVKALAASLSNDSELDLKSAAVAIVGKNTPFEFIEGERLQRYLDEITTEQENQPVDTAMELENPTL
jgi:20S proteasome subunit alpha 6